MRYLTGANEIREAIAHYTHAKTLWLDTEVADYQTSNPRLSLIQVLDNSTDIKGEQVSILDVLFQPEIADEFIEKIMANPAIEKVFHNASYDLIFLGKRKANNVTCTLKMVNNIPYYLVPLPNRKLKTLAEKLCYFPTIDKTEQASDWGIRPLTDKQIYYAKMDPVYVAGVHHRLLQISQLIDPKPETDNVAALTNRYRQLEHRWKQLDSEIEQIKKRLKKAMASQQISETFGFKLSSQNRTTKKVALSELAKVIQANGLQVDCPITLTKEIQKQLNQIIAQLPIEEETKTSLQLKVIDIDEEDVPF